MKNEDLLLELNELIVSSEDTNVLFAKIFKVFNKVFSFELAGIQILNKKKTHLEIFLQGIYLPGDNPEEKEEFWRDKVPVEEMLFVFDVSNPSIQIVGIDSVYKAMRSTNSKHIELDELLQRTKIKTIIAVPLFLENQMIGAMLFATSKLPKIDDKKEAILLKMSRLVAVVVRNTLIYEDALLKEKDKVILLEVTNVLMNIKNREELLKRMATEIEKQEDILYVGINAKGSKTEPITSGFIIEPNKKVKKLSIENRDLPLLTLKTNLALLNGVNYAEYNLDKFLKLCDISSHFRYLHKEAGLSSILFTSFGADEEEVNLILGIKSPFGFLEREIERVTSLLPQISLVFKNYFAYEEIDFLRKKLEEEKHYLIDEIKLSGDFKEMIGDSLEMQDVKNKIKQVAALDVTVLIEGETGTGKELIAYAIHNLSLRKEAPFIKLNCAVLPEQLIESELFGHEKGSFTGAVEKRLGKFELAHEGTIFLDEIGELPFGLQAKFLRVLQEKEFERIGGRSTIKTNVRVIAATNRNLQKEVEKGTFRKDLYFRLNVFPIIAPPLRRRLDDIPLLLKFFVEKYSKKIGKPIMSISKHDLESLMQYNWPGNVRELENVIERAVIISNGANIELSEILFNKTDFHAPASVQLKTLVEVERDHIIAALKKTNGQITGEKGAAKILGINGKTMGSKMRKLGIRREVIISG